jgi:hypothetical protein
MMRSLCLQFICSAIASLCVADEMPQSGVAESLAEITPDETAVRESVARSLPFLESAGVAWMEERSCMSCHHVPFLLWTHRAAAAKEFDIDSQKLSDWEAWCIKDSLEQRNLYRLQSYELGKIDAVTLPSTVQEKLKPLIETPFKMLDEFRKELTAVLTEEELKLYEPVIIKAAERAINAPDRTGGGLDVLGQLLLSGHGSSSELQKPEFRDGVIGLMGQLQQSDGSWVPGNQFLTMRQWSQPVANQSTTMWAAIALGEYHASRDVNHVAIEKSIAWQVSQPPAADNYEWLATRLLFAKHYGSAHEVERFRQQLIAARNADGGWGWQKGVPSDPFTTGLAMYVLANVCAGEAVAEIQSARSFLLTSQQPDGSWHTPSKYISDTTDPERLNARDEIYHYWGTAWATLGLLESLASPSDSR